MNNEQLAEVLELGADWLESGEMDWCQGSTFQMDDDFNIKAVCAAGLLDLAGTTKDLCPQQRREMFEPVNTLAQSLRDGSLVQWNDTPGRTKDEVIDFFKEAAKELRNGATA